MKAIVQSALKVFNLRLVRRTRFDHLCHSIAERAGVPAWHEPIAVEPGVTLALRDLVRPGDTCFDVGSFDGSLTQVLSRATGPRGLVCAFEANPDTLAALTHTCAANALNNVHLVHAAVWHTTGEWVAMRVPPGAAVAAEVAGPAGAKGRAVPTLALDDYARRFGLVPNVVKMDIEGAERHAIAGFADALARHRPHLVLEQRTDDLRAVELVRAAGYDAFDAASYTDVCTAADFPIGSTVRNVVCVHRDRLRETAYAGRRPPRVVADRCGSELACPGGKYELELSLPAGRYVATVDLTSDAGNVLAFEVIHDRAPRGHYRVGAGWFLANARDLPFHLHRPGMVKLHLARLEGSGPVRLERLRLLAVDGIAPAEPLGAVE